MIVECSYLYPDGRHCRRLPRRGETLCRDHRRLAARQPLRPALTDSGKQAFDQQMQQAAEEILSMSLPDMLCHLGDCLNALEELMESKASSAEFAQYTRATMAVTAACDCALAQPQVFARTFPNLSPEMLFALTTLLQFARPTPPQQPPAHAGNSNQTACDQALLNQ